MRKKPNESVLRQTYDDRSAKSDLYRKFQLPFTKLLDANSEHEFEDERSVFVATSSNYQQIINDFLSAECNNTLTITGNTGIGKSTLLRVSLKDYYKRHDINENNSYIIENKKGKKDILIYTSCDKSGLDKFNERQAINNLCGRVKGICKLLLKSLDIDISEEATRSEERRGLIAFSNEHNVGLLERTSAKIYDSDEKKLDCLESELPIEHAVVFLKYILHTKKIDVENISFVLDDIESIDLKGQKSIIATYLKVRECIKRIIPSKNYVKIIIAMRYTTYNSIKAEHILSSLRFPVDPLQLREAAELSKIFEKRFNYYSTFYQLQENTNNHKNWNDAYNVLMEIATKLHINYSTSIIKLSNLNLSDALSRFTTVLSNRKWIQGDNEFEASFKLASDQFQVKNSSVLRALALNNEITYWDIDNYLPNLFIDDDNNKPNMLVYSIYIIKYMYNKGIAYNEDSCPVVVDKGNMCNDFVKIFHQPSIDEKTLTDMFGYILRKYKQKGIVEESDELLYSGYLSPVRLTLKGYELFRLLGESSILLEMYIDDVYWEENDYSNRRHNNSTEDRIYNTLIFVAYFADLENTYMNMSFIKESSDHFSRYFGVNLMSRYLFEAVRKSCETVFVVAGKQMPTPIIEKLASLQSNIKNNEIIRKL